MKVLVNTDGATINTAAATIEFPTDLLQVMSVSESSSIFSLWVQNPAFSNADGTITFTGGLPSPGYTGASGEVVSIVFMAKKQGTASIIFSNSSVLQNDGFGTDVLTATEPATITITAGGQNQTPAVVSTSSALPAMPTITSLTNPDQNAWYSNTSASFNWQIPAGVTSLQTILSKNATAVPTAIYDSSVSQRTVSDIADGIWYFNLRYMNGAGWGPAASYKVQIDSTPPEKFTLNVVTQDTQNVVNLDAVDAMSGIDSYSVKIDAEPAVLVEESSLVSSQNQYVLPTQNPGEHSLVVLAYDKAGNSTESDATFTSAAIVAPVLGTLPEQINRGDTLTVQGTTQYPYSPVTVYVQSEGNAATPYSATTSADGSFSVMTDEIKTSGPATIWAQLIFSSSIQSPISNKLTVTVNESFIVQTSKSLLYILSFAIPALILLLGLLFTLYFGWHKFFGLKRRLHKDVQSAVDNTHHALTVFKEELNRQLKQLEKVKEDRELNKKEEKIFKDLQENIDSIDEFIEKKLKKII